MTTKQPGTVTVTVAGRSYQYREIPDTVNWWECTNDTEAPLTVYVPHLSDWAADLAESRSAYLRRSTVTILSRVLNWQSRVEAVAA